MTSFLCRHEYDDLLVYMDFHRDLQQKAIPLPDEVAGCRMEVVEQADSVTVSERHDAPRPRIVLDVRGGYGYIVLRFCRSWGAAKARTRPGERVS
ncbi:MAG: hypothetical protein MR051_00745 [Lentisphaeria bacterium]|nr:hypothetical protein [Lentisphaeria bacterium]